MLPPLRVRFSWTYRTLQVTLYWWPKRNHMWFWQLRAEHWSVVRKPSSKTRTL